MNYGLFALSAKYCDSGVTEADKKDFAAFLRLNQDISDQEFEAFLVENRDELERTAQSAFSDMEGPMCRTMRSFREALPELKL